MRWNSDHKHGLLAAGVYGAHAHVDGIKSRFGSRPSPQACSPSMGERVAGVISSDSQVGALNASGLDWARRPFEVSSASLSLALRRFTWNGGKHLAGWAYEHLKACLDDNSLLDELAKFSITFWEERLMKQ